MFWIKPRVMDRQPGANGIAVFFLADVSGSISIEAQEHMDAVLPEFERAIPGMKTFAFSMGVREIKRKGLSCSYRSLISAGFSMLCGGMPEPETGPAKPVNGSYIGDALYIIEALQPSKIIVVSDGDLGDKTEALRAADRMTGNIDAYFCPGASVWEFPPNDDIGFMRRLARRGRGRFVQFSASDFGSRLRAELHQSLASYMTPVRISVAPSRVSIRRPHG